MERASNDTGWMVSAAGELQGLTLGFDFCAQHEMGIDNLKRAFGVSTQLPSGLADRKVQRLPPELIFETFERAQRDKRRTRIACALLTNDARAVAFIRRGEILSFWSELGDKWHQHEHDLACAWSDERFAVVVRGAENIARLKELYAAFQRLDILLIGGR